MWKYSLLSASWIFSRWMASNLHLVVQTPQPTHMNSSTTATPQPRQRAHSACTCSSVKLPRRSLKLVFAAVPSGAAGFWRGALSKPPRGICAVRLSKGL